MTCQTCSDLGYVVEEGAETAVARVCACRLPCPVCRGTGLLVEMSATEPPRSRPCSCRHLRRRVSLFNQAGLPSRMYLARLETFRDLGGTQAEVLLHLSRYRQHFVPGAKGLLLWGEPGRGKTHLACALVRHFTLERGLTARFVDFFHLLEDIRAGFDGHRPAEDLLGPLVEPEVLVIDELGKGKASEWEVSVLDQIVSRRYNARRTLIATTNFEPTDAAPPAGAPRGRLRLVDRIDDRIWSRLVEMCDFREVSGPDYRKKRL